MAYQHSEAVKKMRRTLLASSIAALVIVIWPATALAATTAELLGFDSVHENAADAILEAAERTFVAEGYEGATIRKIADEVGVSSTALYMHFQDKGCILLEICERTLRLLLERNGEIAAPNRCERIRVIKSQLGHRIIAGRQSCANHVVVPKLRVDHEVGAHLSV